MIKHLIASPLPLKGELTISKKQTLKDKIKTGKQKHVKPKSKKIYIVIKLQVATAWAQVA